MSLSTLLNASVASNNFTECGIPISVFGPTMLITNTSLAEVQWPCQVREYWLTTIRPFANLVKWLLTYVSSFIVVAGVATNVMSFLLLSASTLDDSILFLYLKALALSDIGALLFNYATGIARSNSISFNGLFMSSKFLCILNSVTMELFQFTSTWLVVCLTWSRVYAVIFPLKKIKSCIALGSILLIVDASLSVSLTKIHHGGYESDSAFEFVPCIQKKVKPWSNTMNLYIALSTWLPLIFIFAGNILLIINIRRTEKIRRQLAQNTKRKVHTNGTLLAVSLVHLILLLPLGIVESIELYWDVVMLRYPSYDEQEQQLYINWLKEKLLLKWCRGLCFHLYHWNFAINFFLYCLTGKKFRSSVSRAFRIGA